MIIFNTSSYNIDWLLCSIIAMLAESNRVPFDSQSITSQSSIIQKGSGINGIFITHYWDNTNTYY